MIQMCSILKVVDNSGAKSVFWINSSNSSLKHFNYNLQKKVSIRLYYGGEARGYSINNNNNKHIFRLSGANKKLLFDGLIVRQKRNLSRFNGSFVKFSNNGIILLDPKKEDTPLGTRIFGVVNKELRVNKHLKIVSLASCVI